MRHSTLAVILAVTFALNGTVAGQIYWVDPNLQKIQRSNLDGTAVEDLLDTNLPDSIDLDLLGCKFYWGSHTAVSRADLDGSNNEGIVTTGVDLAFGVAVDGVGGKVYWVNNDQDEIHRANLDGTSPELLFSVSFSLGLGGIDLDVSAGKMYFTNFISQTIQRANMDGSGTIEDLITTGLTFPYGIAVDPTGGKFYWADTDKIHRADLDGTDGEDLVTGLTDARGVELDLSAGKVYWTDIDAHKIQRADLDGSSVEDVITSGLTTPLDLAIRATGQDNCDPGAVPATSPKALILLFLLLVTALIVVPLWRRRPAA